MTNELFEEKEEDKEEDTHSLKNFNTPEGDSLLAHPSVKKKNNITSNIFINTQTLYDFCNSFIQTTFTCANLITLLAKDVLHREEEGFEPTFLGVAPISFYISVPIAILLAASEAYANYATSSHLNDTREEKSEADTMIVIDDEKISLSFIQKSASLLHYLNDVAEGASTSILVAQAANIDKLSVGPKLAGYASVLGLSFFCNIQNYKNNITAFRNYNEEREKEKIRQGFNV